MSEKKKKKVKEEPEIKKANTVELGYRPDFGRIVWVSQSKQGDRLVVHSGSTHEGLRKAIAKQDMISFAVIDMRKLDFMPMNHKKIQKFLDFWKEHYFNPKFGSKQIKAKFFKE